MIDLARLPESELIKWIVDQTAKVEFQHTGFASGIIPGTDVKLLPDVATGTMVVQHRGTEIRRVDAEALANAVMERYENHLHIHVVIVGSRGR